MFGLGGIDLLLESEFRTCYCQYINRHSAAVQYCIHELPMADLYRWSWGRWEVSESALQLQQMLSKYLKVGQASSLATDTAGTNQLCPKENDVIASRLSLGPISLCHLEFHDRTLCFWVTIPISFKIDLNLSNTWIVDSAPNYYYYYCPFIVSFIVGLCFVMTGSTMHWSLQPCSIYATKNIYSKGSYRDFIYIYTYTVTDRLVINKDSSWHFRTKHMCL